jgi:hypothetical protein
MSLCRAWDCGVEAGGKSFCEFHAKRLLETGQVPAEYQKNFKQIKDSNSQKIKGNKTINQTSIIDQMGEN